MRLLDLFCGAGGAAMGYHRAGFVHIVGVDIVEQPRYPFGFWCDDALRFVEKHGHEYDAIHASPPCQGYSVICRQFGGRYDYPRLIERVRDLLMGTGKPWVIENVVGSTLTDPTLLCGTMFGLMVERHRLFESPILIPQPSACLHKSEMMFRANFGKGKPSRCVGVYGHVRRKGDTELWREAMGIDWMTGLEMAEAIPPAYTEYVGRFLAEEVRRRHARASRLPTVGKVE